MSNSSETEQPGAGRPGEVIPLQEVKISEQGQMVVSAGSPETETATIDTFTLYTKWGRETCCCHNCGCGGLGSSPEHAICISSGWWKLKVLQTQHIHIRRIAESYFCPIQVLFGIRAVLATYATIILINGLVTEWDGGYWFAYFTHMSFLGLTTYVWFATYLTFEYYSNASLFSRDMQPRSIDIFTAIMYTTSFTFHILVPIVYWALLSGTFSWTASTPERRWMNISQHGLDGVIILTEFLLNRIVYSWGHLLIGILVLVVYIFWAWIFAAGFPTEGPNADGFPYFFVNYTKGISYVYVVGIAIFLALLWAFSLGLHYLRSRVNAYMARRRRAQVSSS